MSFRLKTIIGIGIIEAILLLILIVNSLQFLKKSTEEELYKRARTTAELFATTTKDAVLSSDLASLESFVEEVLSNAELEYARVLDKDQILAEGGKEVLLARKFKEDTHYESVKDDVFDTYANIMEEGEIFGRVELGISTSFLEKTYGKAINETLIIATVELILSAIFSFILGSILTKRLNKLKKATKIVADGDYEYQIQVEGEDELAEVSNAFNKMVSNLNKSQIAERDAKNKLQDLNENLEETVRERTRDLEDALNLLEIEKQKQVDMAYRSGVAENAISVLHNIGNVITPVIVQTGLLKDSRTLQSTSDFLSKVQELFSEELKNKNLDEYLQNDPRGSKILPALTEISKNLLEEKDSQIKSLADIQGNLNEISDIISSQQKYANFKAINTKYNIIELVQDAVKMKKDIIEKSDIEVSINQDHEFKEMLGNKNKLMQVLVNFLTNSIESIIEHLKLDPSLKGEINILIENNDSDFYLLRLTDNGVGAKKEDIDKAFNFGFSTKERGSGFGLHDCANFILANKGEIQLSSDGEFKGASISMKFPKEME